MESTKDQAPQHGEESPARRMDRRDFLKWGAGISVGGTCLLGLATAADAVNPPGRSLDGKTKMPPTALVAVGDLKVGRPQAFEFGDDVVWITKFEGGEILALNAACPHVACKLPWNESMQQYACPCHASFFDIKGTKLAGPAFRNMDKAIYRVIDAKVVVSGFVIPA